MCDEWLFTNKSDYSINLEYPIKCRIYGLDVLVMVKCIYFSDKPCIYQNYFGKCIVNLSAPLVSRLFFLTMAPVGCWWLTSAYVTRSCFVSYLSCAKIDRPLMQTFYCKLWCTTQQTKGVMNRLIKPKNSDSEVIIQRHESDLHLLPTKP